MDTTQLQCQSQYWNPDVAYYKSLPLSTNLCSSNLYVSNEQNNLVFNLVTYAPRSLIWKLKIDSRF